MKDTRIASLDQLVSTSTQFAAHEVLTQLYACHLFCAELFKYMRPKTRVVDDTFAEAKSGPGFSLSEDHAAKKMFDGRLRWVFSQRGDVVVASFVLNLVEKGTNETLADLYGESISIYKSIMAPPALPTLYYDQNWLYDCSSGFSSIILPVSDPSNIDKGAGVKKLEELQASFFYYSWSILKMQIRFSPPWEVQ
ncbi:hypothetical protein SPFM15_00211 [Salmonella phage SPFM15]|nr:hypothetical protein SPFM5_00206 [Salmonella phage SPFM5]VFR13835.1 hypothetical protein SPFM15_00211 [Salmonella phage SPFM15]